MSNQRLLTNPPANPTAHATAKYIRVTPMKARRVVNLVRGKRVEDALAILKFAPQAASEPVAKVVASAAANAENNLGLNPATLVISTAYVDEGSTMKRYQPRAQGRAFRIRKRTSHITIEVESVPSAVNRAGNTAVNRPGNTAVNRAGNTAVNRRAGKARASRKGAAQ